jgi:hypothetical protein
MSETLNITAPAIGQPPQTAGSAQARNALPASLRIGVVVALCLLVFMPRFQLNVGSLFASNGLIAQYIVIGMLMRCGKLRVDPVRGMLFILCIGVMFTAWVLNPAGSSYLSAMLVGAAYLAFIFVARMPDGNDALCHFTLRIFSNLMLVAAIAGILQFFMQFVYNPPWLFDYTPMLPDLIRGGGKYNTVIHAGSVIKSNGFFFREPSFFSQFLALAAACEIARRRSERRTQNLPRLATFGFAMLLTYSGTGLATLFIALLFPLGLKTVIRMGLVAIGGILIFTVLGSTLNLGFTAGRINEFDTPGTSAYARFVAPVQFIQANLGGSFVSTVMGHGPGSVTRGAGVNAWYENANPTWAKLLIEYGLVGFTTFTGLMFYSLWRSRAPIELVAAMFLGWLVLWGGIFLGPEMTGLIYVLAAAVPALPPSQPRRQARLVADVGHLTAPPSRR